MNSSILKNGTRGKSDMSAFVGFVNAFFNKMQKTSAKQLSLLSFL